MTPPSWPPWTGPGNSSSHPISPTAPSDLARRAYHDTLAAAILAAALRACPDAQDDDLIVDVIPGPGAASPRRSGSARPPSAASASSSTSSATTPKIPRRFWALVAAAQQPNDYEHTDVALTRLLRHVVQEEPHGSAAAAMAELRRARSAADADRALQQAADPPGPTSTAPRGTAPSPPWPPGSCAQAVPPRPTR